MKKLIAFSISLSALIISACREEHPLGPLYDDPTPPGLVSNVKVTATPGGALLTYSLPKDKNLLYVVAEVQTRAGVLRQFKSSFHTNQIKIQGLGDTSEYKVKLYSVNGAEVRSAAVETGIKPLLPPFMSVFKTLKLVADFGGVRLDYINPEKQTLEVVLLGPDSLKKFSQINITNVSADTGYHNFRGLPAEKAKFGVFLRDRWGNVSDTLLAELTPYFEKQLEKNKFRSNHLPGDGKLSVQWNITYESIWDGRWSSDFNMPYDGSGNNWMNLDTNEPGLAPVSVTIDMGVKAQLSRFRINHYYRYIHKDMKRYEIWGSNNPAPDGSWDSWTLLTTYEQKKPSGLGYAVYNDEDAQAWVKGDQGDIPSNKPAVRYIRIRCLENWLGNGNLSLTELTLWGQPL
ncbi:DUF5000 domain-containing lipoprotein [Chitinophaga sp. NPDC101104]|uniref:DUF5000 domain-containing lipoprotein n=1 Tax=Chitinophaga sp. NPDC101104 TaxID=3390561 RepID=UPI003CFF44E8